jgi:peptidoglycan-N-acetylglucosamine deacetylase
MKYLLILTIFLIYSKNVFSEEFYSSESVRIQNWIPFQVRRAAHDLKAAQTPEEWTKSPSHPKNVLQILSELDSIFRQEAKASLCKALHQTQPQDASLFLDEMLHEESKWPCIQSLEEKVNDYYDRQKSFFLNANRPAPPAQWFGRGTDVSHVSTRSFAPPLPQFNPVEIKVDPTAGLTLTRGFLEGNQIALTFDDGPDRDFQGRNHTQEILETLRASSVRATYFLMGRKAKGRPDLVEEILIDGHSVGSHSWNHANLRDLMRSNGLSAALREITRGHEAIEEVATEAGYAAAPFFRFPYGAQNQTLRNELKKLNLVSFMWQMDSVDWKYRDPEKLYQNMISQLDRHQSGIMLFHDIHRQTAIVMPRFLRELKRRNYEIIVYHP